MAPRKIAADIAGLSGGSRDAWDVKLSRLTPEAIKTWRIGFIRRKAVNPLAEKSAKVSANSFILRARSVFSADCARVSEIVEMPELLPFAGVKVERVRVDSYRSSFDMAALLQSARRELANAKPE